MAKELCFRYEYDARKHLIIKKVPGAGETWMVYDGRDRLVMTQDSLLRSQHKWLFTRYDGMNRSDSTGLITDPTNYNNLAYHLAQAGNSINYPIVSSYTNELLTQNYYDDYSWAGSPSGVALSGTSQAKLITTYNAAPEYAVAPTAYMITRGMITGTKTKVIGTASSFLSSVVFYDDHGRAIQTQHTNYTGATDTLTIQYNFSGQPLRMLLNHQKAGNTQQHHDVLTKMSYDFGQRLKNVWKNIDGAPGDQLIDSVQYNEISQIQAKYLGNLVDSLIYGYNIRGWLTSINKSYVTGAANHFFGMELGYNNATAAVSSTNYSPQYNGNIAGTIWKGGGDGINRKYDFTYDNVDRLTGSAFTQNSTGSTWDSSTVNFSTSRLAYDANGNLLSMNQAGLKVNSSALIDQLTYSYMANSNKLMQVADAANDSLSLLGDFHYKGTKQPTDYGYDGNGSLTHDNNKGIDTIFYNYLNLPQQVHMKGKRNILYTYDAIGNKLTKVVMDSLSKKATTTLYISGFVYQQKDTITSPSGGTDTLQLMLQEEGRVRWAFHRWTNGTTGYKWEYDFFEKDHLGNTRELLTQQRDTAKYMATMEAVYRATENALFYNIGNTNVWSGYVNGAGNNPFGTAVTNPNDSVCRISGSTPKEGPAIILKVMAGDRYTVAVQGYWKSGQTATGTTNALSDILSSLANGIVSVAGGAKGSYSTLSNTSTSPLLAGVNSFRTDKDSTPVSNPKAYLNYIALDDQFNYDPSASGARPLGGPDVLHPLTDSLVIKKNGYLYIYLTNETQSVSVFFDNLMVTHYTGPLMEENHYYPFGLTMAGISDKALKANYADNKYRYNGKELQNKEFSDGTGLEMYDYGARMQDPQLGVWHNPDPLASKSYRWSPYTYGMDNPVRFIDPNGMDGEDANGSRQVNYVDVMDQKGVVTRVWDYADNVNEGGNAPNTEASTGVAVGSIVNMDLSGASPTWASQKGAYVHQAANKGAVKYSTGNWMMRKFATQAMNDGTEWADGKDNQTAEKSYMHEMRNGDAKQSVASANALANSFVRRWWKMAREFQAKGDVYYAYKSLGIALHPIQDATSPAHNGWQPWSDHNSTDDEITHVLKECMYPGENSNLQQITNHYVYMFMNTKNDLPAGDLFSGIRADPQSVSNAVIMMIIQEKHTITNPHYD